MNKGFTGAQLMATILGTILTVIAAVIIYALATHTFGVP